MFRHGEISTETDKKPFFFTLIALIGSLTAAILLFAAKGADHGLAVFAGVLLGLVALASASVLFAMVTDRAFIENETLHMSYMFRRTQVPLREIGKLTFKDNVYSVYDRRGKLLGTINGQLTGIDRILLKLDRHGIRVV